MNYTFENIPDALRPFDHWVVWRYEPDKKGEPTKVPYNARTGRKASSTNARTWSTLDEAIRVYTSNPETYDGVGFVLTDSPFAATDYDHCRDPETGTISPWALGLIHRVASYAEVSPSGTGLRGLVRATLPPGGRKKGDIEMYDTGRYVTLTGWHLDGRPATIEACEAELAALHQDVFAPEPSTPVARRRTAPLSVDEDEVLRRARSAKNGPPFRLLYDHGDASDYPSESEADLALCGMLAFWAGPDPVRVDALFRTSARMRPKWDQRRGHATYGERTLEKALEGRTEFYDWNRHRPANAGSGPATSAPSLSPALDRGSAPTIPERVLGLLPPLWQEALSFFDKWYERDVFLTALLGALSSALPKVRLHYGRVYYSLHLYFFILARAASGKGAAVHAFAWLNRVDEQIVSDYEAELVAWQAQKDAYERAKRSRKEHLDLPEDPGAPPPERCLKAGANTTAAALAERLAYNPNGVFMGSTEADAVSTSNKREHGNFTYLFRAAFHHEEIQIDRKTQPTLRIKSPRFAAALCGTEKQYPRFMEGGLEDGNLSRWAIYSFEGEAGHVSQRPTPRDDNLHTFKEQAAERTLELYRVLKGRSDALYFDVDDALWAGADEAFARVHDRVAATPGGVELLAVVRRAQLIAFRIAGVVAVWRAFENGTDLTRAQCVQATADDMKVGVTLGLLYGEHSIREALRLAPELTLPDFEQAPPQERLTGQQRAFLEALPEAFGTADAVATGEQSGISRTTVFEWLGQLCESHRLQKVRHGQYQKRTPDFPDYPDFPDFAHGAPHESPESPGQSPAPNRPLEPGNGDNPESPESPDAFALDLHGGDGAIGEAADWGLARPFDYRTARRGQRIRLPDGTRGVVVNHRTDLLTIQPDGSSRTYFYSLDEDGTLGPRSNFPF